MRNIDVERKVTGMVQKTCWSMLWQKKELSIMDVVKKGYKENSVRVAFKRFVEEGWATKPDDVRNTYIISEDITK